jgi:Uma2 family endonuclease
MSAVLSPTAPAPAATTPPPVKQPAPVAPPATTWQPFRWTIEQYRELGRFAWFQDVKTMLIDGEIYVMVMPNPPHDVALGLTNEFLRAAFPSGHHVRNQQGFDIGTKDDPGPDLAVVTGSIRDYSTKTPTTAVMIAEISDSTLFMDTTTKAELYATAGVPEYWVVDLVHGRLLVYRDPEPLPAGLGATAYRTHLAFAPEQTVAPLAVPTASVKVADLLP